MDLFTITRGNVTAHCPIDEGVSKVEIYDNDYLDGILPVPVPFSISNSSGNYSIARRSTGDFTLDPKKDINYLNGVFLDDIVDLLEHLYQNTFLDSPYKMIAADVNQSGSLTHYDVYLIRRLVIDYDDEFAHVDSWEFVKDNFTFPNQSDPFEENLNYPNTTWPFPQTVDLDDPSSLSEKDLTACVRQILFCTSLFVGRVASQAGRELG